MDEEAVSPSGVAKQHFNSFGNELTPWTMPAHHANGNEGKDLPCLDEYSKVGWVRVSQETNAFSKQSRTRAAAA
jgi:hypothetical protein